MNDDLADILRLTSDRGLLRTFAALTHLLHVATDREKTLDLREQRDRVEDEILERMKNEG